MFAPYMDRVNIGFKEMWIASICYDRLIPLKSRRPATILAQPCINLKSSEAEDEHLRKHLTSFVLRVFPSCHGRLESSHQTNEQCPSTEAQVTLP